LLLCASFLVVVL